MGKPKTKGYNKKGNNNYKKKQAPFRKPKLSVVFDNNARVDFLTGFHKRKLQRKTAQKLKLEKQLAAERIRIRDEAKKSVGKLRSSSHAILPEVENLLRMSSTNLEPGESTSKSYTMGSKIVIVSSLDNIHTKLPEYKPANSDSEEDLEELEEEDSQSVGAGGGGSNVKSLLKKATNRLLLSSKAYKSSQRIKQKNKKGKTRGSRNPNYVAKRDKGKSKDEPVVKGANKASVGKRKTQNKIAKKGNR